ncbi:MAG: glycoside hydrolase family 3 C-terminal domain-containing protein [Balneolales bacterium]|nr:glycoside hydrolase family 3 C-terminal domain-containing protein [Balneolales bacterium]
MDSSIRKNQNKEQHAYQNANLPIKTRIEDLLSRMSLYEKIGQMTQLDITMINTTGKQRDVQLDPEKARKLILEHHIGSFLNGESVPAQKWLDFTKDLCRISSEETRLGIPLIYGIDHIHGASYVKEATIFPHAINLGATFEPQHAFEAGKTTVAESARLGHHWIFAPVLDLGLNPLWPRFYETYGEDPYLAGELGSAYVRGLQDETSTKPIKTAATGKHFLGYSDPRTGRDRTPAHIPMQQIHEFHRVAFQRAVDAGMRSVMLNSGEVNGVPVHASKQLIQGLLREQMGFKGVVVTDWADVEKLVNFHYTAPNYTEAVFDVITAGVDVCMTPRSLEFNESLLSLAESGRIPESRIDESVRRILMLKFELGLFEHPVPGSERLNAENFSNNRDIARKAAEDSIVLLKNEDVLPLSKPSRIGVLGPAANSKRCLSGGWTYRWQGGDEQDFPESTETIVHAIRKEFPAAEIDLLQLPDTELNESELHNSFGSYDLIVYAGGEEPYTEFAGNINDLYLPENQLNDIKRLNSSGSPVALVLVSGRPRLIHTISEETNAIIFAGLPGNEGATAIAGILSGRVNPSGKLPFSYPMSPNHFLPYNHKRSNIYHFDPSEANLIIQSDHPTSLFPFGSGLSFSNFRYSNLRLNSELLNDTEEGFITATITIENTGNMPGTETVLWFLSNRFGKISRPVKELRHFDKVNLKAGESKSVSFEIKKHHLAYPNENGEPVFEKNGYDVLVGGLKAGFNLA